MIWIWVSWARDIITKINKKGKKMKQAQKKMWVTMTKICRQRIFWAGGATGKEIAWVVITN